MSARGDGNSRLVVGAFLAILAMGAAFRLVDLDRRLMHGDEANQAMKTAALLETGEYRYDPEEHHGPTLYYVSYALERLLGHTARAEISETSLRLIPALFGVGTIALVWLLRRALGAPATLFAALLLALSPALTFYSRYYIQETLLAFFALATVVGVWRYLTERRLGWAIVTGTAAAFMFATKETWILVAAGIVIAAAVVRPKADAPVDGAPNYLAHGTAALAVAVLIWAAFYSSFGTNWRGLIDSVAAYGAYLGRSRAVEAHGHPWHFYLSRLVWHHAGPGPHWTEGFILLAALGGAVTAVVRRNRIGMFVAVVGVVVLVGFSLVRYKTPWNLVQFHVPLCILGGIGFGSLWSMLRTRAARFALVVLVAGASAHLGWLNYAANFEYPEYPYNPYVYGHTSSAFDRLVDRIETVAAKHPEGDRLLIAVIQPDGDYWPIPWYLRGYERVGYWTSIPEPLPEADVFIVDSTVGEAVHEWLETEYAFEMHALRPRILRTVYVKKVIND